MEVIYNNVLYNSRTQYELEEVLTANFNSDNQERFDQCVLWYQSYISGLVYLLNSHKSNSQQLIKDYITFGNELIACVEFMLYRKDTKYYAYIHNLNIANSPICFPLILK